MPCASGCGSRSRWHSSSGQWPDRCARTGQEDPAAAEAGDGQTAEEAQPAAEAPHRRRIAIPGGCRGGTDRGDDRGSGRGSASPLKRSSGSCRRRKRRQPKCRRPRSRRPRSRSQMHRHKRLPTTRHRITIRQPAMPISITRRRRKRLARPAATRSPRTAVATRAPPATTALVAARASRQLPMGRLALMAQSGAGRNGSGRS